MAGRLEFENHGTVELQVGQDAEMRMPPPLPSPRSSRFNTPPRSQVTPPGVNLVLT